MSERTPTDQIRTRVEAARPSRGTLPRDLADRLGATHYDGKYHLTAEPFLVEGARQLHAFGFGCAKFWLSKSLVGYTFNSNWGELKDQSLAQIVSHPHFREALELPFRTVLLEVGPIGGSRNWSDAEYASHERDVHGLAKTLLETYRHRPIRFILQNWEGDWVYRGHAGEQWPPGGPPDLSQRTEGMIRWFAARQRGVERARAEVSGSMSSVEHAVEVNKVLEAERGIPTLHTHVLPKLAVDLISWSCYDGLASAEDLWRGIEILREAGKPDANGKRPGVFIGEIGHPEQGRTREQIRAWWDERVAVLLALDVHPIIHWELYCNEPIDNVGRHEAVVRRAEDMRGYWLIRPDGTRSHAGELFVEWMERASRGERRGR